MRITALGTENIFNPVTSFEPGGQGKRLEWDVGAGVGGVGIERDVKTHGAAGIFDGCGEGWLGIA